MTPGPTESGSVELLQSGLRLIILRISKLGVGGATLTVADATPDATTPFSGPDGTFTFQVAVFVVVTLCTAAIPLIYWLPLGASNPVGMTNGPFTLLSTKETDVTVTSPVLTMV